MPTFAALLRAVNLGATNKIAMGDLRSLVSSLGYEDVATYGQSGNVVFRSSTRDANEVSAEIERRIGRELGLDVAVMVRTSAELAKIAAGNPFVEDEADHKKLHVLFLDKRPAAKAAANLDPERSPPDRFHVLGREAYLHLPNGSARSKLTIDYFERGLGVRGTGRNWKTVKSLVALTRA